MSYRRRHGVAAFLSVRFLTDCSRPRVILSSEPVGFPMTVVRRRPRRIDGGTQPSCHRVKSPGFAARVLSNRWKQARFVLNGRGRDGRPVFCIWR